ncbi:hypothetical protein C2W62_15195 [Candidatus Entotheonella serta]|nr:hypothetical protein C2W62_15195 [Candidatus Entotheonella serta]
MTGRIGIDTGMVIMGAVGLGDKRERLALGKPPHIAVYLQSLAESDAVLISADTYRLVEGYYACQALGTHMTETGGRSPRSMIGLPKVMTPAICKRPRGC